MCSAKPASPHPTLGATASAQGRQARSPRLRRRRGNSSVYLHIIGQVRLWIYHDAIAHARGTGLA
jgi:hypothetical protein